METFLSLLVERARAMSLCHGMIVRASTPPYCPTEPSPLARVPGCELCGVPAHGQVERDERPVPLLPPALQHGRKQSLQDERSTLPTNAADLDRKLKARQRALWALGDYHRVATDLLWEFGRELVDACGIYSGQRVLDVAAGTGNVAIRAAEKGAQVVASDLTPENFDAGRHEARAHGVELAWVEADAEALPFDDGEFDVVTSSAGAIFAPHHQLVADQLLRVCRPGGTIGMTAFVRAGLMRDMFEIIERYLPPLGPDAKSVLLWGDEQYVRALFGDRVESLDITRKKLLLDRFADPDDFCRFMKTNHPLVVGLHKDLIDEPARVAVLDLEMTDAATRWDRGAPLGPAVYEVDYLLIVARKRDS